MARWLLAAWLISLACPGQAARLFLIIDDVGYNRGLGEQTVNLPGPLNLAFLPHTPFAKRLANTAWQQGHCIMLHAPMDNDRDARLGPGALTASMHKMELQKTLRDSLAAIPHVSGVNNHMGSSLTRNDEAMRWVMEVLSEQKLFFVDSKTTPDSVAFNQARQFGLASEQRDIFLDNDRSEAALLIQYNKALTLARQHGSAVLIGHPYPETLNFLAQQLSGLADQGIELARLDHSLKTPGLPSRPPSIYALLPVWPPLSDTANTTSHQ